MNDSPLPEGGGILVIGPVLGLLMWAGILAGCANVSYRWPGEPVQVKAGQTYHQTEDGTITIGTHNLPVPVEPDVELPPPLKMTESYTGILLEMK